MTHSGSRLYGVTDHRAKQFGTLGGPVCLDMVEAEELACYSLLITGKLLIPHKAATPKTVFATPIHVEFTLRYKAAHQA